MKQRLSRWLVPLTALAMAAPTLAFPARQGAELQVNSYTSGQQSSASVATAADGDFVVVWRSYHDGYQLGVFAQRFASGGAAQGSEFQVNTSTAHFEYGPGVASESNGDFVVVWHSFGGDGDFPGVFLQRFDSAGGRLGGELQVNTRTQSTQRFATIGMDADGDFVVAWQSFGQDASSYGVFAQRFGSNGSPQATEFQVNSTTFFSQAYPVAAMDDDGDFVVVWVSANQDDSELGVFGQLFASTGSRLATEFQVSTYTVGPQSVATVAMDSDGDFVVAWQSYLQDGSNEAIFARRFASSGEPKDADFQVTTYTQGAQQSPTAAMDDDGDFFIAWQSTHDGSGNGVFGQSFTTAGLRVGPEFQINSYTTLDQVFFTFPRPTGVGMDPDGDFVVVWQSLDQDKSLEGVFAQRFASLANLDVDGNGSLGPLTDGLLVLRRLFGFTGATLVTGAVDLGGCTRCTAGPIEDYIATVTNLIDIDGNGSLGPLTDGLLILRYLFGFTGATLTTGAFDAGGCTRCNATAIAAYLDGLAD